MEFVIIIALVLVFVTFCCSALVRWNEFKYRIKGLPPGTMGWPIFGETTQFLKQGPNFMTNQRARYGNLFKTHILGCPTVVSMDPELNKYILMNEWRGLVPGYPQSMLDILGTHNIAAIHGPTHKRVRGSLLAVINPNAIRHQLLSRIDHFMRAYLSHWDGKVIDIQDKTKEMTFLSAAKQVVGNGLESVMEEFKPEFYKLVSGTLSLPIDLPGTEYRRGIQARKEVVRMLRQLLKERRSSKEEHQDMLEIMMKTDDHKYKLSDEELIDQIITILNSGFETVSRTSMMAVKYLYEHPDVLQQLRKEHLAIREKKQPEDPIDINDLLSMTFTRAVILETSRLATIVNGVLRKTTGDLELNGFVIPKGWRIYVYTREINYDEILYPEPFKFNPWRWLQEKKLESHNHLFFFGGGTRLCPGKELGIAEISTFLHYFVIRYRWELIGGDKLINFPRVEAPNGLHIRVSSHI